MKCQRCGNCDPAFFYQGSKGIICRRCVRFRVSSEENTPEDITPGAGEFVFAHPLTSFQKEAVQKCKEYLEKGSDVLLKAVCGAGKTEMCVPLLAAFLRAGKKVGFAFARREVVIELAERFRRLFPYAKVTAVYGGHSLEREGDIILCTTHQLYHFPHTFAFLVLDEVDAFPFRGDEVLWNIARNACTGNILYSTATIDERLQKLLCEKKVAIVEVNRRPHGKELPLPCIRYYPLFLNISLSLYRINNHPRRLLVFVATRREAYRLAFLLKPFIRCAVCTGESTDKQQVIAAFMAKKIKALICTSVLERGVTFPDVDVLMMVTRKGIFEKSSYIQMSGRAGRNFLNPVGEVIVHTSVWDKGLYLCRKEIAYANQSLSVL